MSLVAVSKQSPPLPATFVAALAGILALWIFVPSALVAEKTGQSRWIGRVHGVALQSAGDQVTFVDPVASETSVLGIGDGSGFGLGVEWMLNPRFGFDAGILVGDIDTEFTLRAGLRSLTDSEETGVEAYTVGLNYHLTPEARADVYVGAFFGMIFFDDTIFLTEAGRSDKRVFDDDTGFGLRVGVDVPFTETSRWSFSAELRYFDAILEGEIAGQEIDFNALIPAVGVSRRF